MILLERRNIVSRKKNKTAADFENNPLPFYEMPAFRFKTYHRKYNYSERYKSNTFLSPYKI